MNQPLLFSLLISLLALPFTGYGAEVDFQPFARNWLANQSAETRIGQPAVYVVRREEDLRKLPLEPSDINYDAFQGFDFQNRALVFLLTPDLRSSAYAVEMQKLEKTTHGLSVAGKYRRPSAECLIPTDLSLIADVVTISQSAARTLARSRYTPDLKRVRYRCPPGQT